MSNKDLCKGKHLKIEDRLIIEYGLDQNYTLKKIAEMVKKDPTTKLNRFIKSNKKKQHDLQSYQHFKKCTKINLCNNCCRKQCKKCRFINYYSTCNKYSPKKCTKLNRYPYVCNSCSTVTTCTGEKTYCPCYKKWTGSLVPPLFAAGTLLVIFP